MDVLCPATPHERWRQQSDKLFDRASDLVAELAMSICVAAGCPFGHPVSDERLDMVGKLLEAPASATPDERRKLSQDRYPRANVARSVALARQPGDVTLYGLTEPAATNPVNGVGLGEILFQHDNLLSSRWERR